jgi:tetratricopeptide (TPR) repeat protein
LGYLQTHQEDEAETFLDRWCQLQPDKIEPYRQRLNLLMSQQKVAQAIRDAQHILRRKPDDFEARLSLVMLLKDEGRYDEAEKEAKRCSEAHPGSSDVQLLLAHIYRAQKRTDLAADLTDQLLRVTPDDAECVKLRAQLYLDAGQPEPAIALLQKLVAATDGKGVYLLSVALTRAGRYEEAKKVLAEIEWHRALSIWRNDEHGDDNGALQQGVVQSMLAVGKTDDAIRFLSDILKRNPQAPPRTHQLLADCYDKQGRPELAAQERRRAGLRP